MLTHIKALFEIDPADTELFYQGLDRVSLGPFKNTIYYLFPQIATWGSNYTSLARPTTGLAPYETDSKSYEEIEKLRKCAALSRKILVYSALNYQFDSFGGGFSLSSPIIVIPFQYLFRPRNLPRFGLETKTTNLSQDPSVFSDDETRFLIARELAHLKLHYGVVKTMTKVIWIVSLGLGCIFPLCWLQTALIVGSIFAITILFNQAYEQEVDYEAIRIVGCAIQSPQRALKSALSALKKIQLQNVQKRAQNVWLRLFILRNGDHILDLQKPLLSARIMNLGFLERGQNSFYVEGKSRASLMLHGVSG